jgi:hypothetical protein
MAALRFAYGLLIAAAATPSVAGPPYLTDDPIPTDLGHWEIYAFATAEGHGSRFDGDAGVDLNYGAAEGVQLTATLPVTFSHVPDARWQSGTGDVELGVKYRFFEDDKAGFSAAVFPRAILPTASHAAGEKTRLLLPLWLGKDFAGGTHIFGGGGYEINPGLGNRDFWQAAVAATQDLSSHVSIGAEITRQGPEETGGTAQTRAGIGSIVKLGDRYALLFSGGPTWADHKTSYHFYAALGLNF